MLSESPRIRLSAPEEVEPPHARIPVPYAWRWYSPYELQLDRAPVELAPSVAVFMSHKAYLRCCAHGGSDLDREVGGVLVGRWRRDVRTEQPFIVIEAALPARHTRQGSAFLTFTQDSLVAIHDDLEKRFPGRELVGWYHTHPRMGVFLSGYDMWLHQNFFPNPWQVALVIEPHSLQGGFFIHHSGGRLDPRRYFGFYELVRYGRRSVMCWTNLRPQPAAPLPEGG